MPLLYIPLAVITVAGQIILLDSTAWSFLSLPLIAAIIIYLRRGLALALVFGVVIMWLWDINSFTFGLRAVALLLTFALIHLVRTMVLTQTKWFAVLLLSFLATVFFQLWLLLGSAVIFGWRYYALAPAVAWYGLFGSLLAALACAIIYALVNHFQALVKR